MTKYQIREHTPFEEDYLASFNRVARTDLPADMLYRYFRADAGVLRMPDDDPFFITYSKNTVLRALRGGYEPVLLIMNNDSSFMDITEAIRAAYPDLPVCIIDEEREPVSGYDPHAAKYVFFRFGPSVLFRKKPLRSLPDILQTSKKVVVFRGFDSSLEDMYALGYQVRSAAAFFADAVIYQGSTIDPYSRILIRGSTGNNLLVPFTVCEDDRTLMRILTERSFTVVLASSARAEGAVPLNETGSSRTRLAVILDRGIQKGQRDDVDLPCAHRVYIPGGDASGVSPCAASIILYSLFSGEWQNQNVRF